MPSPRLLAEKFGKKWYFLTPDYAFGHTLQAGFEAQLKKLGGTVVAPIWRRSAPSDFSAFLIKARAAKPDVLIVLFAGTDQVNCIKQVVQFGLDKQFAVAGGQNELENVEAMPPEARIGWWVFEWVLETGQRSRPRQVHRRHPRAHQEGADGANLVRATSRCTASRSSRTRRRRWRRSKLAKALGGSPCRPRSAAAAPGRLPARATIS